MEGSQKAHAHRLQVSSSKQLARVCWETMRCAVVLCPAHNNWDEPCWRIPETCCENHSSSRYGSKLESCLACSVFKEHAEADPRGWNLFVASEVPFIPDAESRPTWYSVTSCLEVFKDLPCGFLTTNEKGRIFYVNAAAEEMLEQSAAKILGKPIEKVLNENPGRRQIIFGRDFEVAGLKKLHGDERVISVISRELAVACGRDSSSVTIHVLADVTDHLRLKEHLQSSENNYRRLFEGSKDMIFIHSKGGILKDVNQACVDMLEYESKEELLSVASVERIYVNPMHRKVFQQQIDRNGYVKDFETSFKKKDGTRIYCLVSGTAVTDKDGKIIGYETIAKDVTARMDGVRNLHHQHRELSLLHSVAVAMNVTHELEEVLLVALKKVLEVLGLDAGAVFLINHDKSIFELKVHHGLPARFANGSLQILLHDQTLMQALLKADRSIRAERTYPPIKVSLRTDDGDELPLLGFLIIAKGKASGFIGLKVSPSRLLNDRDHQMLGSLGNFLGSAIENSYLVRTIREHREELMRLTARLFHSQEEERRRIAQELHDEAGQALTGINFTLETIIKDLPKDSAPVKQRILEVKKQINRTYQEMRRISHRLHPAVLSDLGLEPALESRLAKISKHSSMKIDFKMVGFDERLDPQIETVLYRISLEAINNALKHSGAKRFKLSIIKSFPNIIFLAEDDGVGFDPNDFERKGSTLGLLCMRERAAMVGGTFSLKAAKGKGTRIRIEIPIKEAPSDGQKNHHSFG